MMSVHWRMQRCCLVLLKLHCSMHAALVVSQSMPGRAIAFLLGVLNEALKQSICMQGCT